MQIRGDETCENSIHGRWLVNRTYAEIRTHSFSGRSTHKPVALPLTLRLREGLNITSALQPVAWLSCLWCNCVDLRTKHSVLFVEHCVVETIQVIEPHTEVAVRAALLILNQ